MEWLKMTQEEYHVYRETRKKVFAIDEYGNAGIGMIFQNPKNDLYFLFSERCPSCKDTYCLACNANNISTVHKYVLLETLIKDGMDNRKS